MSVLLASSCRETELYCNGRCVLLANQPWICDGKRDCRNGQDELDCLLDHKTAHLSPGGNFQNNDVATQIVLPTIIACIVLVASMLFGINKCKEWELDRLSDMRRTRRIVQRLTARLREKNLRTLEKARELRKRSHDVPSSSRTCGATRSGDAATHHAPARPSTSAGPPPTYEVGIDALFCSGTSPPPAYEDALLDEFCAQLLPGSARSSIASRGSRQTPRATRGRTSLPRSASAASAALMPRSKTASIFPV